MWSRKHLHIRGENRRRQHNLQSPEETPPHTWRKCLVIRKDGLKCGNTSTYVEKIKECFSQYGCVKKHLHIRGENVFHFHQKSIDSETPPHTWRKLFDRFGCVGIWGNTSTYVEKMAFCIASFWLAQKHLHIRGENSNILEFSFRLTHILL